MALYLDKIGKEHKTERGRNIANANLDRWARRRKERNAEAIQAQPRGKRNGSKLDSYKRPRAAPPKKTRRAKSPALDFGTSGIGGQIESSFVGDPSAFPKARVVPYEEMVYGQAQPGDIAILEPGQRGYVPQSEIKLEQGIQLIREAVRLATEDAKKQLLNRLGEWAGGIAGDFEK